MEQPVTRIVIVGGGTAGWLSACYLASRCSAVTGRSVAISLLEAPDIPTVGVGEGTWPTMRQTLSEIGLDEAQVLAACDGAFKQGSRFDGWVTGRKDDSYYHPFTPPPDGSPLDLLSAWQEIMPDLPFASAVSGQPAVCQAHLAPRQRAMPPYTGALNYAYHLDAAKLAGLLSGHATETLGITHLRDEVVDVEPAANGDIAALVTRSGTRIEGDLFIDCSGQAALLIGGHCSAEWVDVSHLLANDRALATQVPLDEAAPIESQTIGTAHSAGWIWDIGLPNRRGVGCVYSSKFMDDSAADQVLRDYVSRTVGEEQSKSISPRQLSFRSGHRREFWRGNCLAIGLSAGFVEPLEASAIVMIELSLRALVDNFPRDRRAMHLHSKRFNELFQVRWSRVVEFLKLHYVLSKRDEPYWQAQRDPEHLPGRLSELIELWEAQPPSAYDFPLTEEIFPAASYQYVYYGMGRAVPSRLPKASEKMRRNLELIAQRTRGLLMALPPNRALLHPLTSGDSLARVAQA